MKQFIIISLLLFSTQIFAQIPAGYYDGTDGLEGSALKTVLFGIIKNPNVSSYDGLWTKFKTTDRDNYYENDASVMDIYSENPNGADPYTYHYTSDQCGSYGVEGDCYNREHSFPKSWFNDASPMYSDLFHLYPTDGKVNGYRSNYPYGNVSSASWTSQNGSKLGTCSSPTYSGTVFEPIDEFKGDLARTYFYMATCYEDKISSWNSAALAGNSFPAYTDWYLEIMLQWNSQDPVSDKEIDRNNAIYNIQGNRNPYIDHPEWVECVWGTCSGLNFTSTPVTSAMETQTYTYNITYNVDAETETLTCPTKPSWLTFSKNEANNTAILTGTPGSSDIGNHNVVIQLDEAGETKTQNFTIAVAPYSVTQDILNINFTSCPPSGWETISVSSDEDWSCGSATYEINGYGANTTSDDWFISPSINLDNYNNENLTFKTWTKYSDDGIVDPEVKLKYSTNYSGNPSTATWHTLSYTFPTESNQEVWTASGNIDFSGIIGTNINLAFHYTSSGTDGGSSAYWQIDDILLTGDVAESINDINSKIKIYPNPANQIVNINSLNKIEDINIYSVIGQKVLNFDNLNTNNYEINIRNIIKGIYFIEIKDINNNKILKKLIKE